MHLVKKAAEQILQSSLWKRHCKCTHTTHMYTRAHAHKLANIQHPFFLIILFLAFIIHFWYPLLFSSFFPQMLSLTLPQSDSKQQDLRKSVTSPQLAVLVKLTKLGLCLSHSQMKTPVRSSAHDEHVSLSKYIPKKMSCLQQMNITILHTVLKNFTSSKIMYLINKFSTKKNINLCRKSPHK